MLVRSFRRCRVCIVRCRPGSVCCVEVRRRAGQCATGVRVLMVSEIAAVRIMSAVVLVLLLLMPVVVALMLIGLRHVHRHAKSIVVGTIQQAMLVSAMALVEHVV